jgi:Type I restriction modification DNA specificity domain
MSARNGDLPAGWVRTTLSEVAFASRAKAEPGNLGNISYIGLEHIEGGSNRILSIGRVTDVKSTKSIFQRGDVLYGKLRPYLKKVCSPDFDGVCSTDILVFPQSPNIDNGYLLYFLSQQSTADYATQNSNGINLPRISSRALGEIEFPLPPLTEQQRIVVKIEALQERSLRAREALSEVEPLLEQFRQSVLAAAFRGDLTADWRAAHPNVEPASELLQRIGAERRLCWEQAELAKYEAKGQKPPQNWKDKYKEPEPVDASSLPKLPNGWEWVRVKSVGGVQLGRQRSPQYHSGPNMCPYLRVMNVFEDRIDTEDIMKMDFSLEDFERYRLESGDILLNEGQSRELVGRSAIYRGEVPGACFTNTLVRFHPDAPIGPDYPQIVFLGYKPVEELETSGWQAS